MVETQDIISEPDENRELELAMAFVQLTGSHVFLTGKAGTGKTTFLSKLKEKSAKRMIITAPTGVAAINASGVTLHSFFQLPFGPFIPGSEPHENNRNQFFRFSKEKRRIIQNLDLLVIDEISMVRADLLDAVDAVLQRHRRNNQPFGGVQLLLIGDLHQLPPVAKQEEWHLLQQYYDSVYFFSSHALNRTEMLTIELKHIYRQSDAEFIELLNQVRENRLDEGAVNKLGRRYNQNYHPEDHGNAITLTTHNNSADAINASRLTALPGEEFRFAAEITGEFPEHAYPVPNVLILKPGAQVMFLRNDASAEKRYFNGKIGRIKSISSEAMRVLCPGETESIVVNPVEWENIKYTVSEDGKEIQEEIIGKLKQFPLKPAWAITIHKSQGLTFDQAVIDAQSAFANGQFYVALSRCRTLEGLVLSSPIPTRSMGTDPAVLNFIKAVRQKAPSDALLSESKIHYQQQLLLECFDFQLLRNHLNTVCRLLSNKGLVQVYGVSDITQIREMAEAQIFSVGDKFKLQLQALYEKKELPESDPFILERIEKASAWFQENFSTIFNDLMKKLYVETDNKEMDRRIDFTLTQLRHEITKKLAGIRSCEHGFSPNTYLRAISNGESFFVPEKRKPQVPDYRESDITHHELFQHLKEWRSVKAKEKGVAHFQILHQRVAIQIAIHLPDSVEALKKINGVGNKTIENYGSDILELVSDYREKHGVATVTLPDIKDRKAEKPPVKKPASGANTKDISLEMFNKGIDVPTIVKERGLTTQTIEAHLCFFVENGTLAIDKLLSPEKQKAIETVLANAFDPSLKSIKEKLGEGYSYGDIKLMKAHKNFWASKG